MEEGIPNLILRFKQIFKMKLKNPDENKLLF